MRPKVEWILTTHDQNNIIGEGYDFDIEEFVEKTYGFTPSYYQMYEMKKKDGFIRTHIDFGSHTDFIIKMEADVGQDGETFRPYAKHLEEKRSRDGDEG